jgi:dephospho-CoA kinase
VPIKLLITGLSGTGKSTLIERFAALGYKAVDLDSAEWSEFVEVHFEGDPASGDSPVEPNRDWVWHEDRVEALLSAQEPGILFVAGCAPNMRKFCPQFDYVVLLTAPSAVMAERLSMRVNNDYGKNPGELARVLAQREVIEPRLREIADYEIDSSASLDDVVRRILDIVQK